MVESDDKLKLDMLRQALGLAPDELGLDRGRLSVEKAQHLLRLLRALELQASDVERNGIPGRRRHRAKPLIH